MTLVGTPEIDLEAARHEQLVPYKVPVRYESIDELPRSEVGKVLRKDQVARL